MAMKIRLDVEATPQELRVFFGLPDVEAFQQELLDQLRRNMQAGMEGFDPATFMAPFLPAHLRNLEALQTRFWQTLLDRTGKESEQERGEGEEGGRPGGRRRAANRRSE